jgi:peptidoglycan-associated lipoprotein
MTLKSRGLVLFAACVIGSAAFQVDGAGRSVTANEPLRIHFEFNESTLLEKDIPTLHLIVAKLENRALSVRITGHCDERGTEQYNLALGDRRAHEASGYLLEHGIGANRIETISYGKERPLCTAHSEECWARNRRDEFSFSGTP